MSGPGLNLQDHLLSSESSPRQVLVIFAGAYLLKRISSKVAAMATGSSRGSGVPPEQRCSHCEEPDVITVHDLIHLDDASAVNIATQRIRGHLYRTGELNPTGAARELQRKILERYAFQLIQQARSQPLRVTCLHYCEVESKASQPSMTSINAELRRQKHREERQELTSQLEKLMSFDAVAAVLCDGVPDQASSKASGSLNPPQCLLDASQPINPTITSFESVQVQTSASEADIVDSRVRTSLVLAGLSASDASTRAGGQVSMRSPKLSDCQSIKEEENSDEEDDGKEISMTNVWLPLPSLLLSESQATDQKPESSTGADAKGMLSPPAVYGVFLPSFGLEQRSASLPPETQTTPQAHSALTSHALAPIVQASFPLPVPQRHPVNELSHDDNPLAITTNVDTVARCLVAATVHAPPPDFVLAANGTASQ